MQCPYCAEDILDAAIVCPYCRHDLAPSRHLIDENKALHEEVTQLRAEIASMRAENARAISDAQAAAQRQAAPLSTLIGDLVKFALVPIALLLFAHFLIILSWDKPTVYLRIVSILLPVPFGFFLVRNAKRSLAWAATIGALVSVVAIYGMSLAVALHDGGSVLPSSTQEWTETVQYFISIALAFLTGGLLAAALSNAPPLGSPGKTALVAAKIAPFLAPKGRKLIKGKNARTLAMIERALGAQKIVAGVVAAATTAGSIYTGVMSVLH
jgi:hypothetical protein